MRLPYDRKPAVGSSIFPCNLGGTVLRAVVDANYFDIAKRLIRNGIQALPQIIRSIIDWYYNRDHRGSSTWQDRSMTPRLFPKPDGVGRIHISPPEMRKPTHRAFPWLLSAGEMRDPHLFAGQGDLLRDAVVAELHVPARVERRDRAFADEVQGVLVAVPFSRFENYLFEPVEDRLAAETLQIHDQHAGVDVAVPFREAPFGRPGNIFGLCGVNHVFRGGEIVVANICRIQLAEVAAHGDVHVYVHNLVVCGEDAWQKQPVARRQRQPGRLFVARKPGCHKFIRNIDESHGRMAGPGVSGDERPDRIFRDARVQDYDVQVASGRVRNRRVYCDFEIRQIILVRRQRDGYIPHGKGRLDVRSRDILHFPPPFRMRRTSASFLDSVRSRASSAAASAALRRRSSS